MQNIVSLIFPDFRKEGRLTGVGVGGGGGLKHSQTNIFQLVGRKTEINQSIINIYAYPLLSVYVCILEKKKTM